MAFVSVRCSMMQLLKSIEHAGVPSLLRPCSSRGSREGSGKKLNKSQSEQTNKEKQSARDHVQEKAKKNPPRHTYIFMYKKPREEGWRREYEFIRWQQGYSYAMYFLSRAQRMQPRSACTGFQSYARVELREFKQAKGGLRNCPRKARLERVVRYGVAHCRRRRRRRNIRSRKRTGGIMCHMFNSVQFCRRIRGRIARK